MRPGTPAQNTHNTDIVNVLRMCVSMFPFFLFHIRPVSIFSAFFPSFFWFCMVLVDTLYRIDQSAHRTMLNVYFLVGMVSGLVSEYEMNKKVHTRPKINQQFNDTTFRH